jgi:hypothetical protein
MSLNLKSVLFFSCISVLGIAQNSKNNPLSNHGNKFEQLGGILPTPNEYRTASGSPGNKYWQQRADYLIEATLSEKDLMLVGKETVTYINNSPDKLNYLWMQLDENIHQQNGDNNYFDENKMGQPFDEENIKGLAVKEKLKGLGTQILSITDELGNPIKYTINQTMMRIDLPKVLNGNSKTKFIVKWQYKIPNRNTVGGRGGYEYFPEDGNYLFTMSQWYPRMCVYSDFQGWQNKQFTGRGEFALVFGNYTVKMTVPSDHVVCSTGECQNYAQILTPTQMQRYTKAVSNYNDVTEIITLDECTAAEKNKLTTTKTYIFKADSVRDFAWGSSRKFMWDAMPIKVEGKKVMCMSFYGKEAAGLYRKYSTKTVAHTIKTYSKFTIPYTYPVAQSIEASNGMEYPMICFNFGRTEKDGTYTEGTKYGMLCVIIHEVGHNFFPMIINSDERQWTWMDEGLNSFMEFLAESTFDPKFPLRRGPAKNIVPYMSGDQKGLEPIMSNSESIRQFGNNAYGKPATALNILRETIMGHELFDYAFKTYANRWKFKHPTPEDFFRTMEDASAVDLDWFWRGWFYTTDANDIGIKEVKKYFVSSEPSKEVTEFMKTRRRRDSNPGPMVYMIADGSEDYKPEMNKPFKIADYKALDEYVNEHFSAEEKAKLNEPKYFYQVTFDKPGGLVMPIIVELTYEDGTSEIQKFPAQIWRMNDKEVSRTFATQKVITKISIDPNLETADIDVTNNTWPKVQVKSKFD